MAKDLWHDIDAMGRLAESERSAMDQSAGAAPVRPPRMPGVFPAFPDRDEFAIHAVDSPARVVTGDSYDFFFVSDDVLAVMISDVSGKGIPAALLMGVTKSMVRNLSSISESPADTLTRVNQILHQTRLGAMYATVFLGWYDTRTGLLRYVNGGHPLPYRIDRAGKISTFGRVTGPILGILDVEAYSQKEEQLEVGDRLVLYTDGVTEATCPEGNFFGAEGLTRLLERHGEEPVNRLAELIVREICDYQGAHHHDDATLVAFHRRK
jgi:sigma-B regulation protein RsbU (phosphoserine phosphatase)